MHTPKSEKLNTLKRKSPDPSALEALELHVETTPTPTPTNTRRSKLQKKGKSDSPGSVGRSNSNASNGNGNGNGNGNSTTLVRTNSRRRQPSPIQDGVTSSVPDDLPPLADHNPVATTVTWGISKTPQAQPPLRWSTLDENIFQQTLQQSSQATH